MRAGDKAFPRVDPGSQPSAPEDSALAARWLTEPEGMAVVRDFHVPVPAFEVAAPTPEAVLSAAGRVGYPLVLKVVSPDILHKTDVGAVAVGIDRGDVVPERLDVMLRTVRRNVPSARLEGVLVQTEAPAGAELIVGARRDPQFGPVVAIGLGGTMVELLANVSLRLAPLSLSEASEMIDETWVGAVLRGLRGSPPLDRAAVECLLLDVSRLAADRRDLLELDLNPVRVYPRGVLALDVRMRICGELEPCLPR
jgi:acyl-CoA synthetase (NDP forming)